MYCNTQGEQTSEPRGAREHPTHNHENAENGAKKFPSVDKDGNPISKKRWMDHPCYKQYNCCQFGGNCELLDYPSDTCISHFQGTCVFGDSCRKRHIVDGVDIRELRRARGESHRLKTSTGEAVDIVDQLGTKLQIGRVQQSGGTSGLSTDEEASGTLVGNCAARSLPLTSESHTSPWIQYTPYSESNAPKPFLNALQKGIREDEPTGCAVTPSPSSLHFRSPAQTAARALHPCISQFGSCRYGQNCNYANIDANACVLYLNSRCLRGASCTFRHEDIGELKKRAQPHPSPTAACTTSYEQKSMEPGPEWVRGKLDKQQLRDEHQQYAEVNDSEFNSLLRLLEVFEGTEPAVLIHALRAAGGDMKLVANTLAGLEKFEGPDELCEYLKEQHMEELKATKQEGCEVIQQQKQDSLLTLCALLPDYEPSAIEAVLERCGNDCAEAYSVLFCTTENITKQEHTSLCDRPLKAPDEKNLRNLYTRFSKIPKDVVCWSFKSSGANVTKTTDALNSVMRDMYDSREAVSRNAAPRAMKTPSTTGTGANRQDRCVGRHEPNTTEEASAEELLKRLTSETYGLGDWRRVRERAYFVNQCRLRVLSQAASAYMHHDGGTAKKLSLEARKLAEEYNRLNQVAMLALEQERLANGGASTLDLHGFHAEEVLDVMRRRVKLCLKKGIHRLRIVTGRGNHSRNKQPVIHSTVKGHLESNDFFKKNTKILSVRPEFIEVKLKY